MLAVVSMAHVLCLDNLCHHDRCHAADAAPRDPVCTAVKQRSRERRGGDTAVTQDRQAEQRRGHWKNRSDPELGGGARRGSAPTGERTREGQRWRVKKREYVCVRQTQGEADR
ncbi:hypothetical protein NDU88_005066 [Pleurodeles waltl]|uniref:Secreted protein n=1 Tax=Pleurodeles waltl TaxID=8319 RepID=A0AAV7VIS8_PLEWA|nr:hypothetical protein NDU88_005066 [Pleurodeles waltl]